MKQSNLAKIFKALSHEKRLQLFRMIYDFQKDNCPHGDEIRHGGIDKAFTRACEFMGVSRSTVSHHLKELENSGLIIMTRKGQSFECVVNEEVLGEVKGFLE